MSYFFEKTVFYQANLVAMAISTPPHFPLIENRIFFLEREGVQGQGQRQREHVAEARTLVQNHREEK